jgi:Tfp pilus assembly protein PilO
VTERFTSLSPRAQTVVVGGALILVAVLGYFVLIAPKRSTATDLKKQTAAVQAQIKRNQGSGFSQALPAVRAAKVFQLTKAMPNQVEMPNVILQLSQLALQSGINFDQISPGSAATASSLATPDTTDPFAAEPIEVAFTGSFYDMLAFLQRVRNLVRVDNGRLDATGRLFDVTDIEFCVLANGSSCSTQPLLPLKPGKFPIQATLTLAAFVPQTPQAVAPITPGSTDTTSTSTTSTTTGTTTTTSTPTSASPSTSGGTS